MEKTILAGPKIDEMGAAAVAAAHPNTLCATPKSMHIQQQSSLSFAPHSFISRTLVEQFTAGRHLGFSDGLVSDLTNALRSIDQSRFGDHVHIAVLGGTKFYSSFGEEFCKAIGESLSQKAVLLAAGGMAGVGETVTRAFAMAVPDSDARIFHFLPHERTANVEGIPDQNWDFGRTFPLGKDWLERREGLAHWSRIYLMVEGGPGANHEANLALRNGAVVIPLRCSGGGAAGMTFEHADPLHAKFDLELAYRRLQQAQLLTGNEWEELDDGRRGANELVKLVNTMIAKVTDGVST